jgi:hypothetical protein
MRTLLIHTNRIQALVAGLLLAVPLGSQVPPSGLNPAVQRVVSEVSEQRIAEIMRKLEGFGTRHVMSAKDDPQQGIGAAARWISSEFQGYSPRLEVRSQPFTVKRAGAYAADAELSNVIAVLPGTTQRDRFVIVSAHYDSINLARKAGPSDAERLSGLLHGGMEEAEARRFMQLYPTAEAMGDVDAEATAAQKLAPGVADDASGTAAVMELARVMSRYTFEKTLVFVAFSAEEGSHTGSKAFVAEAKKNGTRIEAVLNNDIIGTEVSGNGLAANNVVRVFAEGPEDSASRALLRYCKEIGERYVPSMRIEMVFRLDRFSRGGDHMSFVDEGFPAVRITTTSENFEHQHNADDTMANSSAPYTTRVARMNAAVAASLALAPAAPEVHFTFASGRRKGQRIPLLSRGISGYDAILRWESSNAPDLAGYAVMIRATTSPVWEREIWVGNVTSFTLSDFSIDNVVLGVKAVDRDGNQSPVSAYIAPTYQGGASQ